MLKYLLAAVLLFPSLASAEPWVIAGQNRIPGNQWIFNPSPNDSGMIGQVLDLPWTVPIGCELHVTGYGLEGTPPIAGINNAGLGMFLFVGDWPDPIPDALHGAVGEAGTTTLISSNNRSAEFTNLNFRWPAGTTINVAMVANGWHGYRWGWHVTGDLACID